MRLQENQTAPHFTIKDIKANDFDLHKPRKKLLMLSFFRYASCPLCNLRVHELIKYHDRLKESLDVVMVFQSPAKKIDHYVGKQDIPYVILPNPDKSLYHLYGVENSWLGFAKAWTIKLSQVFDATIKHRYLPGSVEGEIHRIPADFIIDTDGKILRAYYGKDIGDHLPLSEIYRLIESHETR